MIATLAACTGVTPEPESELGTQARSTQQIEPQAKSFIQDPEAKGGEAAILYKTGQKATFKLNEVASGAYKVSVRARAEAYEGYPVMRLHRNGERLGEDNPVKREGYGEGAQKFGEVELAAGDVLVAEFTNDLYGGSADKDRNLVVDHLILKSTEGASETEPEPSPDPTPKLEKKLIEYGWDVPTAEYVRDNIEMMEERPFDGLAFRIGERDYVSSAFDREPWAEADMQLDVLEDIAWDSFTDNFLIVWANTDAGWFDDAHWDTVTANMRLLSKALDAADAKGILFDPEFYSAGECHPWRYETFDEQYNKPACDYGGRSLEEVEAKVRERGERFINALEANVDSLDLISLHFMHGLYQGQRWGDTPIPESKYALFRAFTEGMLKGADQKTRLIDGNENAYYYDDTRRYTSVYEEARQDVQSIFTSDEYARLYEQKVGTAFATYLGCNFATASLLEKLPGCGGVDEDDQARLFEQNIYNALLHSDEYVWLYSEAGDHPDGYDTSNRLNWWSNPPEHVPPGAEEAIERARNKLEQEQALGFNIGRKTKRFADESAPLETMTSPQLTLSVTDARGEPTAQVEVTGAEAQNVELYLDSLLIGERDQAPYTFNLDALGSGQHTLFARAFRADGGHTMSNPITVDVP